MIKTVSAPEMAAAVGAPKPNAPGWVVADGSMDHSRLHLSNIRTPEQSPSAASHRPDEEELVRKCMATLDARGELYGPAEDILDETGCLLAGIVQAWTGQRLETTFPSHVVAMMMAGIKLIRNSKNLPYNEDNYIDAIGYILLARRVDKRKQNENPSNGI